MTVAAPPRLAVATFSITGGLAREFLARGDMIPWSGILVVEGPATGDRRSIAPDALEWRDLPLPFMFQFENPVGGDGHDGATLVGRIDTIVRLDEGRIFAEGWLDPSMPDTATLVNALDKQLLRGVSVDLDKVASVQIEGPDGRPREVITAARISGATACPFQAFMEAEITFDVETMSAMVASGAEVLEGKTARVFTPVDAIETLIASAGRGDQIGDPPADWFANPNLKALTPLTVTADGRVFGHIAAWGTCHISFANRCVPVPRSNTKYAAFRTGSVLTAEGTTVRTGPILMDTVHPDLRWRASDAQAFYADTGCAVCDVVPYEDEFGIVIAGATRPAVKPEILRAFRASDVSPDWRNVNGQRHECVAMLAVNNSGFKLPQTLVASAGMAIEPGEVAFALDEDDEVYALVASGPVHAEPCCSACAEHGNDENDEGRLAAIVARFGPKPARRFRAPAPPPPTRSFRSARQN